MRIRIAAALALAPMLAGIGIGAGVTAANASAPVVSTVTRTEYLVSPRCYHETQVTKTYRHWSSKTRSYVLYNLAPRVTVLNEINCHA